MHAVLVKVHTVYTKENAVLVETVFVKVPLKVAYALYRFWKLTALNMPRKIPDSSGSNDPPQRTLMGVAGTVVRTDTGLRESSK